MSKLHLYQLNIKSLPCHAKHLHRTSCVYQYPSLRWHWQIKTLPGQTLLTDKDCTYLRLHSLSSDIVSVTFEETMWYYYNKLIKTTNRNNNSFLHILLQESASSYENRSTSHQGWRSLTEAQMHSRVNIPVAKFVSFTYTQSNLGWIRYACNEAWIWESDC